MNGVFLTKGIRYIVCEYFPPGNVLGQFQENVLPQVPAASEAPSTTGRSGASAKAKAEGAARRVQRGVGKLWAAPGLAAAVGV